MSKVEGIELPNQLIDVSLNDEMDGFYKELEREYVENFLDDQEEMVRYGKEYLQILLRPFHVIFDGEEFYNNPDNITTTATQSDLYGNKNRTMTISLEELGCNASYKSIFYTCFGSGEDTYGIGKITRSEDNNDNVTYQLDIEGYEPIDIIFDD